MVRMSVYCLYRDLSHSEELLYSLWCFNVAIIEEQQQTNVVVQ